MDVGVASNGCTSSDVVWSIDDARLTRALYHPGPALPGPYRSRR